MCTFMFTFVYMLPPFAGMLSQPPHRCCFSLPLMETPPKLKIGDVGDLLAERNYTVIRTLGHGTFGAAFSVRDRTLGDLKGPFFSCLPVSI